MPQAVEREIPPTRTIAVLTSSAYDESLLEMALARLGLTALLLSVNNSVPAVAHLAKITNATHMIFGDKYVQEAKEAQSILKEQGYTIDLVADKRFPLWGPGGVDSSAIKHYPARLTPDQENGRPAVLLHSSGSVSRFFSRCASVLYSIDWIPKTCIHYPPRSHRQRRLEPEQTRVQHPSSLPRLRSLCHVSAIIK